MKEVGINIMKYPKLFAAIGITLVSAFLFSIFGNAQQSDDGFNLSQKEQIEWRDRLNLDHRFDGEIEA